MQKLSINTKTDRELIELAAKAVGYEGHWHDRFGGQFIVTNKEGLLPFSFNPLSYDSDAFRLMTALELTPHFYSDHSTTLIVVDDVKDPEGYDVLVKWNGDMAAATRRAIVMAAAKIGEGVE